MFVANLTRKPMHPTVAHLPFTTAVAAAAATLPHVSNVLAQKDGGWHSVRYTPARGIDIALEATRTAAAAVAFFVKSAGEEPICKRPITYTPDFATVDFNNPALTFGGYIAPMPATIHNVFPLTADEHGCKILAVSADWRRDDDEATTGCFAVARPVAREDWARIEHGTPVVYTELYCWPEILKHEYPGEIGQYISRVGTFILCDDERNAFYASMWGCMGDGDAYPLDYTAADVCEVYTIERFIEAAGYH